MSWTNRKIIEQAFAEIGIASFNYDLKPSELQFSLDRLGAMLDQWQGDYLWLNYNSGSGLDDESNIPSYANRGVLSSLAIELAPSFGKQISRELKVKAQSGMETIMNKAVQPEEVQMPSSLPVGSGNKPWRSSGYGQEYFHEPVENDEDPNSSHFLDN